MNRQETELFEDLERHWVNYFSKCERRDEIPWRSSHPAGQLVDYLGDIPRAEGNRPDMMPGIIDKYRKFQITHNEQFAARMIFKVPKQLRIFVMLEPLIKNKPNKEGKKPSQSVIAAACGCTLDQYKKRRGKAKDRLVSHAMINAVHAKRSA